MTVVSLTNPGLIPIEAVTTMGVSAKDGENPIGFFGTGLKYAIASLLRLGHKVTIYRGLERYDFCTEVGEVRGKEFNFIRMNGPDGDNRLGFTTHLGAKWEMWQAFRELYSNCLDESGSISFSTVQPEEDVTTIHVSGEDFAEAARLRDKYFLATKPIHSGLMVDVHPGPSSGIYYRGVLAARLETPSVHTYNITTSTDLTEDRTIKHRWMVDGYIAYTLTKCADRKVLDVALTAQNAYEAGLGFSDPSEAFAEAVLSLCETRGTAAVSGQAVRVAEQWAQRDARVKEMTLSPREQEEVSSAKAFLASIGYAIEAQIVFTETLGADVFGMAKDGKIFISRVTLSRGGNFLIGTILEEHLHLTHGFEDESRRFQDYLIDLVVKFAKDAAFTIEPRMAA